MNDEQRKAMWAKKNGSSGVSKKDIKSENDNYNFWDEMAKEDAEIKDEEEKEREYEENKETIKVPEDKVMNIIKNNNGITALEILDKITGISEDERLFGKNKFKQWKMNLFGLEESKKIRVEGGKWYAN